MHEEHSGKQRPPVSPAQRDDDAGLRDELQRLRRELERAGREEPPALIDRAVLNAAHRAMEPRAFRARRWRWLGGLATAAVAVLTLSLLLLQPEAERPLPPGVDGYRLEFGPAAAAPGAAAPEQGPALRDSQPAPPAQTRATASPTPPPPAAPGRVAEERTAEAPARRSLQDAAESDLADEPPGAEEWIERMLELRRAGETDRLASELARFRAVYPAHPLPAELSE